LGLSGCKPPDYLNACAEIQAPGEVIEIAKGPWTQQYRLGTRLRFETVENADLPLTLDIGERCLLSMGLARTQIERTYTWPSDPEASEAAFPDVAGAITQHESEVDEQEGEAHLEWTLYVGPGEEDTFSGHFFQHQRAGEAFTVGFVGSTQSPQSHEMALLAAEIAPDVLLHGGDVQQQASDIDTWAGFFHDWSPVLQNTLFHPVVGDADQESGDEYTEMFVSLFGDQGRPGGTDGYYAFDVGLVRFIGLNSEGRLDSASTTQVNWLEDELRDVRNREDLGYAVVILHDALYSLGPRGYNVDGRQTLQPLFESYDVPLVLSSQTHAYERFEVNGVNYVVEGGGGAELEDPQARALDLPEDALLQQVAIESFGLTRLDVDAAGTMTLSRVDQGGVVVDEVQIVAEPEE